MPIATLLLREQTSTSLTTIVEKSQQRKLPLPEYELQLNSCQLDLKLISKPERYHTSTKTNQTTDEGFESDVDSLSIVSSDDSFTSSNIQDTNISKTTETDSANGSASSDSDTETPIKKTDNVAISNESYHLVDCVCYTDVKFPNLLVFVIKCEALVFKFENLDRLQNFYVNFSALKAVTNQKAYSNSACAKFNLLQRTDNNGVTHIEITREPEALLFLSDNNEPTSIISLNTPESSLDERFLNKKLTIASRLPKKEVEVKKDNRKDVNSRQRINTKSVSSENLLDLGIPSVTVADIESLPKEDNVLRKVWNSAEDLLIDSPRRPERRRKLKGKAPPPPINQNVLKGNYVRVNVEPKTNTLIKVNLKESSNKSITVLPTKNNLSNILCNTKTKLTTYQQFKTSEISKKNDTSTLNRCNRSVNTSDTSWTNSVPRLLKKPRSRSETRNFTPMAYRYIDTTQNLPAYPPRPVLSIPINGAGNTQTISNRLFGMSSKLKDFSRFDDGRSDGRWNSLGELNCKIGNTADGSLKSVIKKDDNKRKSNEKKVTFSAYTTVQVV